VACLFRPWNIVLGNGSSLETSTGHGAVKRRVAGSCLARGVAPVAGRSHDRDALTVGLLSNLPIPFPNFRSCRSAPTKFSDTDSFPHFIQLRHHPY
jgi:hypothetical protein